MNNSISTYISREIEVKIDFLENKTNSELSLLVKENPSIVVNNIIDQEGNIDHDLLSLVNKKTSNKETIRVLETYFYNSDQSSSQLIIELLNEEIVDENIFELLKEFAAKYKKTCWAIFFEERPTQNFDGELVFSNGTDNMIYGFLKDNIIGFEKLILDSLEYDIIGSGKDKKEIYFYNEGGLETNISSTKHKTDKLLLEGEVEKKEGIELETGLDIISDYL